MKKSANLLLAVFTVFLFSCNNKQDDSSNSASTSGSPEEMAKEIVKILSEKNYASLSDITLTKEQRLNVINNSGYDSLSKKDFISKLETDSKDILSRSKNNFDETIKNIEADGIVLKEIKYKDCDYTFNKVKGVYTLDLYIQFDFKGNEYNIRSASLLKEGNNWRFTGDLTYKDIDDSNYSKAAMEARAQAIQDSIAASINAEMDATSK